MSMTSAPPPARAQKLIKERLKSEHMRRRSQSLGETLMRMGRLSREQVDRVLARQEKTGALFGKTAVKLGFLKPHELRYALGVQLGFLHETNNLVEIPEALIVARDPYSPEAEQFRLLRTRLVTRVAGETLKMFSIVGADAKVRAADVAANLAASFAQISRKTLLIDADLRKPSLAKMFGEPGAPGVTEIVRAEYPYEEALRETLIKNLNLMPSGVPAPDPQIILSADAFGRLLERSREDHDIVIVLTAPFGPTADGEFAWAATRSVLALAKKHYTRADTLTRMRSVVRGAGAEMTAAAMIA